MDIAVCPIFLRKLRVTLLVFGYDVRVLKIPKGESRVYGHSNPSVLTAHEKKPLAFASNSLTTGGVEPSIINYDATPVDCLYGTRTKSKKKIERIMNTQKREERKRGGRGGERTRERGDLVKRHKPAR